MRQHSLAIASLLVMMAAPLPGCIVVDSSHPHAGGPPPHAPAHGYRWKHDHRDYVYDDGLGVYVVGGLRDVWFLDDSYFRLVGDRWEIAVSVGGPWRVASVRRIPARLYAKRHPHGMPPGQAKKQERGHGHD